MADAVRRPVSTNPRGDPRVDAGIPGLLGRPGSRWGLHHTRKEKDEAPRWS